MIRIESKKRKAYQNALQMSLGNEQNPMQLVLNGEDKGIQISFNSKDIKKGKLTPGQRQTWIPPPAKSTRRVRSCCLYKYPTNEIVLSIPEDGKFVLPNGLPVFIESSHLENFKAAIYPQSAELASSSTENVSSDSLENYTKRIKDSYEKQHKVLKESEKVLKEHETKKKVLSKYIESLKRNMNDIGRSIKEIEAFELDTKEQEINGKTPSNREAPDVYRKSGSKREKSSTSGSSDRSAEEITDDTIMGMLHYFNNQIKRKKERERKQKAYETVEVCFLDEGERGSKRKQKTFVAPTEIHIPAEKLISKQIKRKERLENMDKLGKSQKDIREKSSLVENTMVKLADNMRKSKILVDSALQKEQAVDALQKSYIQGVEELYNDQQRLLNDIYQTLDAYSTKASLNDRILDSDLGELKSKQRLKAEDSPQIDNLEHTEDDLDEDNSQIDNLKHTDELEELIKDPIAKFKMNSMPEISNFLRNKTLSEKLAMANFELEKLKKELQLAKTKGFDSLKPSNLNVDRNAEESRGTEKECKNISAAEMEEKNERFIDEVIGRIVQNYNLLKTDQRPESIFETTVTHKVIKNVPDNKELPIRFSDEESFQSLSGAQKSIDRLEKTMEELFPTKTPDDTKDEQSTSDVQGEEKIMDRRLATDQSINESDDYIEPYAQENETQKAISASSRPDNKNRTSRQTIAKSIATKSSDKDVSVEHKVPVTDSKYKRSVHSRDKRTIPPETYKTESSEPGDKMSSLKLLPKGSTGFDIEDHEKDFVKSSVDKQKKISSRSGTTDSKQSTKAPEKSSKLSKMKKTELTVPDDDNIPLRKNASMPGKHDLSGEVLYANKAASSQSRNAYKSYKELAGSKGMISRTLPRLSSQDDPNFEDVAESTRKSEKDGLLSKNGSSTEGISKAYDDSHPPLVSGFISKTSSDLENGSTAPDDVPPLISGFISERSSAEPDDSNKDHSQTHDDSHPPLISGFISNLSSDPEESSKSYSQNLDDAPPLVSGFISESSESQSSEDAPINEIENQYVNNNLRTGRDEGRPNYNENDWYTLDYFSNVTSPSTSMEEYQTPDPGTHGSSKVHSQTLDDAPPLVSGFIPESSESELSEDPLNNETENRRPNYNENDWYSLDYFSNVTSPSTSMEEYPTNAPRIQIPHASSKAIPQTFDEAPPLVSGFILPSNSQPPEDRATSGTTNNNSRNEEDQVRPNYSEFHTLDYFSNVSSPSTSEEEYLTHDPKTQAAATEVKKYAFNELDPMYFKRDRSKTATAGPQSNKALNKQISYRDQRNAREMSNNGRNNDVNHNIRNGDPASKLKDNSNQWHSLEYFSNISTPSGSLEESPPVPGPSLISNQVSNEVPKHTTSKDNKMNISNEQMYFNRNRSKSISMNSPDALNGQYTYPGSSNVAEQDESVPDLVEGTLSDTSEGTVDESSDMDSGAISQMKSLSYDNQHSNYSAKEAKPRVSVYPAKNYQFRSEQNYVSKFRPTYADIYKNNISRRYTYGGPNSSLKHISNNRKKTSYKQRLNNETPSNMRDIRGKYKWQEQVRPDIAKQRAENSGFSRRPTYSQYSPRQLPGTSSQLRHSFRISPRQHNTKRYDVRSSTTTAAARPSELVNTEVQLRRNTFNERQRDLQRYKINKLYDDIMS